MRLNRRVLTPAVALLLVAAGLVGYRTVGPGRTRPAPFVVVDERGSLAGLHTGPGVLAIANMVTVRVTAPFTLVRAAPLRTDPHVEVVAVRALFQGLDETRTRSGYRRVNDGAASACGNWPVTGYGPTYPVENLRLQQGDNTLRLIYYTRSEVPGRRASFGYRIDYRTPDGRTGRASSENMELEHTVYAPGTRPVDSAFYTRCHHDSFTSARPGFPS